MTQPQPQDKGIFCPYPLMAFDEGNPESWLVKPESFHKYGEIIDIDEAQRLLNLRHGNEKGVKTQ